MWRATNLVYAGGPGINLSGIQGNDCNISAVPYDRKTFRKQEWMLCICKEGLLWSSDRRNWLILYLLNDVVFFPLRMLRSNRISCVGNDSFIGLSSVRLLSLYDNQITTIAPGAFDTLHSLSTL